MMPKHITASSASKVIGRDVGSALVGFGQTMNRAAGAPGAAKLPPTPSRVTQSIAFSTVGLVIVGTSGPWPAPVDLTLVSACAVLGSGAPVNVSLLANGSPVTTATVGSTPGAFFLSTDLDANVGVLAMEVTDAADGTSSGLVIRVDWAPRRG